jgi:adhesin transport system membrane fusion protein
LTVPEGRPFQKHESILHPLRVHSTTSAAAAPPRVSEVAAEVEKSTAFPRRIDRIATEAQGRFVVILGICGLLALVFSIVVQIDKVTRASGRIVTQQTKQEVQHLEGGIIAEILVKEGDTVVAGQPLMRVENSFFKSELAQAAIELAAKRARILRLDAETSGAKEIEFPPEVTAASRQGVDNEISLFRRRQANLNEQLSILAQQQRQKEIELSELRSRQPSVTRERQISEERLLSLKHLSAIGAASNNECLEAERVLQQAISRLSDLAYEIPRTEAALAEIGQRKAEAVSRFQADAEKERAQTATDLEKLTKSIEALQDRSRRSDVNATVSGTINKLNVTTVGGVVKPGEPLAEIVPADSLIEVEMKLPPADRADVWPGQRAIVKVSAYEFSVYGGLSARVLDISPDAHQDERGVPYFRVRLEADAAALGPDHPVLPGMGADVDVIGNRQSLLGMILKPLRRLKDNALRQ